MIARNVAMFVIGFLIGAWLCPMIVSLFEGRKKP